MECLLARGKSLALYTLTRNAPSFSRDDGTTSSCPSPLRRHSPVPPELRYWWAHICVEGLPHVARLPLLKRVAIASSQTDLER
jgi:hypothetical protein